MRHRDRYYAHNCHGIDCRAFMEFQTSFRWDEVRDFFPQDDEKPPIPIMRIMEPTPLHSQSGVYERKFWPMAGKGHEHEWIEGAECRVCKLCGEEREK
jgi:hypothetical protein